MASATHPGEILKDELQARGMCAHRFALELGVPPMRIADILKCRRSVPPETALGLAAYLGGGPKVWLRLQADYDLTRAEWKHRAEFKRTLRAA